MGDWSFSTASPATRDFLSLCTSRTQHISPVYRNSHSLNHRNPPEIVFTSPVQSGMELVFTSPLQHNGNHVSPRQHHGNYVSPRQHNSNYGNITHVELEDDTIFCNRNNVDDCVSYLDRVSFLFCFVLLFFFYYFFLLSRSTI